jgi:hypothetical protein
MPAVNMMQMRPLVYGVGEKGRGRDEDFSSPPRTDPGVRC